MNFCKIKTCDVADGPGVRTTLFVSGCRNHCRGCFQPETWDFDYGEPFTEATIGELIKVSAPSYIRGLTLLGGDPFEPENQRGLVDLLKRFRKTYPEKNIWAYTGYIYDQDLVPGGKRFCEVTDTMLELIDVLVDGPFVEPLKNLALPFRGSENQRLIDLKETRTCGRIILIPDDRR